MFAPAIVGAGMRLSARAFEPGRSALLNSAGPMAEGWRSALHSVSPEKSAARRLDTSAKIRRSAARAGLRPLLSASIDFDDGMSCGRGRLGPRRQATRSSQACAWRAS
jgi:hypothetical protein